MERYPDIRWIMPHAGGILPSILYRLQKFETLPKFKDQIPAGVRSYLKRIYYDVAQATELETLRALMELAEPDHLLLGTDFPFTIDPVRVIGDTIDGDFCHWDVTPQRLTARNVSNSL